MTLHDYYPFAEREIQIEIVYNIYRVKPALVYGPSQLCHAGSLEVRARP
jgi:hypothetical protein